MSCSCVNPKRTRMCKGETKDKETGLKWLCTRERGHEGAHVACSHKDHNLHSWTKRGKKK